jgi:hypothetical protein
MLVDGRIRIQIQQIQIRICTNNERSGSGRPKKIRIRTYNPGGIATLFGSIWLVGFISDSAWFRTNVYKNRKISIYYNCKGLTSKTHKTRLKLNLKLFNFASLLSHKVGFGLLRSRLNSDPKIS